MVVEPKFNVTFPETAATAATDRVERIITPRFEVKNDGQPLVIDEQQRALQKLAYETDGDGMLFAASVDSSTLLITHFVAEENFMTGAVTLTPNYTEIPLNSAIDDIVVTPDLRQVMVRRENRVHIFDISVSGEVSERDLLPMRKGKLGNATGMYLLAGASSILLTHDTGLVSQWFEVPGDEGRQYQYIRQFDAGSPVTDVEVEYYRRTFYTLSENGELNIFHTTSEADLYQGKPAEVDVERVMVDPRANYLLMKTASGYSLFDVDNEHPEVTWVAYGRKSGTRDILNLITPGSQPRVRMISNLNLAWCPFHSVPLKPRPTRCYSRCRLAWLLQSIRLTLCPLRCVNLLSQRSKLWKHYRPLSWAFWRAYG